MSIEAMKQALAALETCRIRSVSEWEVSDVTPKNVTAAISALRTAIQQADAQQPATGEPVQADSSGHLRVIASLGAALRRLSFAAQTTGGTDGPDAELQSAIGQAEQALSLGGIWQAMSATAEPVLFIHPDTFAMDNAHVGAWKPGHELTGYIPLYTHPAPGVPRGAVNLGAHSLASELAQAVAQDDDDPEGHDMSAGLFGPTVSAWLRKVAADFLSHPSPGEPVTAVKSIHVSQGALKCTNGTQNTLLLQQEVGAVGDTKTPENGFQGPLAQDLSTKAGASQVEPFAHICIVNTKDAGPTKFFTAPSDPRAIPVYTHPAPSVPDVDFDLQELREIERAMDDFADCGETDVSDALLLRGVRAGFLECTHFHVANRGALQDAIDAAMIAAK